MLKKLYHPKLYIGLIIAVLVLAGVYLMLCRLAGARALEIFNREMARQTVLEGSVAVDSITADMWGNVGFRGLNCYRQPEAGQFGRSRAEQPRYCRAL